MSPSNAPSVTAPNSKANAPRPSSPVSPNAGMSNDSSSICATRKAVQAATPRLAYMAEKYPIEMPAYAHTDEQVLRDLTGYLLAQ